jgi:hypothetical protein
MDAFDHHRKRIALQTLRLSDTGADLLGGMTKAEAHAFLKERCGYTEERLQRLEEPAPTPRKNGNAWGVEMPDGRFLFDETGAPRSFRTRADVARFLEANPDVAQLPESPPPWTFSSR